MQVEIMSEAEPGAKMKKRERKGQARKRVTDDSDEEDKGGAGGDEIKRKTLEEIREEQRQRKIRMGLQAASTLETGEEVKGKKKKKQGGEGGEEDDEDDEEKAKEKTIGERMESSFTGIRYMAKRDENVAHKKIMEEYIQEKLGVKKDGAEETEGQKPGGKLSKRDKLLQITREIQPEVKVETSRDRDEGVGEGAPIAYSTGIAEVSLPIDVKLKNIEETQRALEAKQRTGRKSGPDVDHSIIGNLTTNYHHFRKDHAERMRERDQQRTGGGGFRTSGYHGKESMTDDMVYERFKKRTRR